MTQQFQQNQFWMTNSALINDVFIVYTMFSVYGSVNLQNWKINMTLGYNPKPFIILILEVRR